MRNHNKYAKYLYSSPIIKYISKDIEEIIAYGKICSYKKKDIIFYEGVVGQRTYVLLEGIVRLYRTAPNGQQRTLMFVKPGEVFGNIPLVDGEGHTVTAEVFESAIVLAIENQFVKEFIKKDPELLWYLSKDLTKKLRITNQAIEDAFLAAEQRIMKAILLISDRFGKKTSKGIELRLRFTQDDLARFSGTTRSTVANVVSSLIDQGILSTKPKPWIIYNINLLRNL